MYIQDMANTKGHVAAITGGMWHPKEDNLFISASLDGTVRQWDMNSEGAGMEGHLPHRDVLKVRDMKGLKTCALACTYNHKGNQIFAGC